MPRRSRPLVVGVVHTVASPCRCHASILPGLRSLGHHGFTADGRVVGPSAAACALAPVAAAAVGWSYEELLARLLADRLAAGRRS